MGEANFYSATFSEEAVFLGVTFSEVAHLSSAMFSGDANFDGVTFSGEAIFWQATFSGDVDFQMTMFSGVANFIHAKFLREANFFGAMFSGLTWFHSTRFERQVIFHCQFGEEAVVTFDGETLQKEEMFSAEADFISCIFGEPRNIKFRKVSLEKCQFLETDVSAVQFIDVTWDKKRKLIWSKRNAVYDESHPDNLWLIWKNPKTTEPKYEPPKFQYHLIAQLYRRLQANYINNYRYSEAGDFYIGEQEMVRKAKGKVGQYLSTNFLYKIISYYGESFTLPLFWLAFVLLLLPAVLLYDGINLNTAVQNPTVAETVNYEWSWSPGDFLPVNGDSRRDYWEAFKANFSLIAYSRSDIGKYLPESGTRFIVTIESLIIIALLAFFLLALRRQYKRKTF